MTSKFAEILEMIVDRKLSDVHCSLPAVITKYDKDKQKANVQPLLKQRTIDLVDNKLPIITDVPVFMPRANGFFMYIPIKVGDVVSLVFTDYSIDGWVENGAEQVFGDLKSHSLDNCYAMPFINYWSNSISGITGNDFVIKNGSLEFIIKTGGEIEIKGGNLKVSGDVIAGSISLQNHMHPLTAVPLINVVPAAPVPPPNATGTTDAPN